jgi:hypothetical protein
VERSYAHRPLLDKLGVKPGMRVAIVGVDDDGFRDRLAERTDDVTEGPPAPPTTGDAPDTDLVFLAADFLDDLHALAGLRERIRPNGAIWVVSRKGRAATLRDVAVMDAAKSVGLVDNKVVAFSDTHTAIRLVIPVALRPR